MNLVQSIQDNWNSLPGSVRGALAMAAGAAGGVIEVALTEPSHFNLHQVLVHAGAMAVSTFLFYLVPNARNRLAAQNQQPVLPAPKPDIPPKA